MKKLLLLFLISCSTLHFAQEQCIYKAMILDSLDLPVYDASITAFDENNNSAGYTFSDYQGEFKLEMPCGKSYELEIEHLSYEPLARKVNLDKSKREKIVLKPTTINLKEVIAKGRTPIKVKGDTIEYDADSFKTGQEEDLEDILKKLPGIQVEKGKVYYQGKEITSIKIEGREVFGGNTKLLTKNLPSDAVDKIQLNKKFKSNPFANSLQDDEKPELNITLKDDKKSLIFGNTTIGGDAIKHYEIQEKLFRFSTKTDASLISDFNTYGKEVFSSEDYFNFLGGISELTDEGGSIALRNSLGNILFGNGNKATSMKNHLGAINLGYEPIKTLNITAFSLATNNNLKFKSTSLRVYPNLTEKDETDNDQNIFSFISRVKFDYNIDNNSNLKYRINYNQQDIDNTLNISSYLNDNTTSHQIKDSKNERANSNLNQRLSYIRKIGSNDNFGLYFTHSYLKDKPNLLLSSTKKIFNDFFDITENNQRFTLNQSETLNSNTLQGLSIYNHLINNLSNLRIKLGANFSFQNLNHTIKNHNQELIKNFVPTDMDFQFTELYADATYTRKINKLKFDVGLGLHKFKTINKGNKTNTHREITKTLPHLNAIYEFNNGETLVFKYDKTYEIPQVREITDAYNVRNYYSIFRGNPALQETKYHQASLRYNVFNYFKIFNLSASLSYSKKLNNIRTNGTLENFMQFNTPFNSNTPEDFWNLSLYGSKRFNKKYTLKVYVNANHFTYLSKNNNIDLHNNSKSIFAKITNNFKLKKKLEIDAGISYNVNQYTNPLTKNVFTNIKPFLSTAWVVTENILLQTDYEFNNQYNNGEKLNDNHDLNATIRFKPMKKVYGYITVGNLLNNHQIVTNSFNNFYTTINTRETLGRYILAKIKIKF